MSARSKTPPGQDASDPPTAVGNDVVDLAHPRCTNRPPGDPLLRRILAPGEEGWLESGPKDERPLRLWALWAAKEAAFKVHSQLGWELGGVFRPAALACELALGGGDVLRLEGRVLLDGEGGEGDGSSGGIVRVEGTTDGSYVHVVGWIAGRAGVPRGRLEYGVERGRAPHAAGPEDAARRAELDGLRGSFSPDEWAGIRSLSAANVRLLARTRVQQHLRSRGENGPVEILTPVTATPGLRRGPPKVWVGGREGTGVGVSLSHHGRYVAWALLLAPEPHPTEIR